MSSADLMTEVTLEERFPCTSISKGSKHSPLLQSGRLCLDYGTQRQVFVQRILVLSYSLYSTSTPYLQLRSNLRLSV